jgi:hypothetical protein
VTVTNIMKLFFQYLARASRQCDKDGGALQ